MSRSLGKEIVMPEDREKLIKQDFDPESFVSMEVTEPRIIVEHVESKIDFKEK